MRDPHLIGNYIGIAPFGANVPDLGINTTGSQLNLHTEESLSIPANFVNWIGNTIEPNATGSVFPVGLPITVQTPSGNVIPGLTGVTCLSPSDKVISGPQPPSCTTEGTNPNLKQAYLVAWNFDVQRAITNGLMVDVAYVGNHGANQNDDIDINQPRVGSGWDASAVGNCLASAPLYTNCKSDPTMEVGAGVVCTACPYGAKYPFLSNIAELNSDAFSNYDALQITLNERPMHGLAFLAAYTYSHALDVYSMANNTTPSVIDAYNIRLNYGNSNFDIRHRFTFSPIYVIPGIKSPGQMLQGWAVSGILTLYGGLPWFPSDTTDDLLGTNEFKDGLAAGPQPWNYSGPVSAFRANSSAFPCYNNTANGNSPMSGCTSSTANVQAAQAWSSCQTAAVAPYGGNAQLQSLALASLNNIGCYVTNGAGVLTPPAYGTVGNASRNVFRSPGYHNVDFSVSKDWKFKERYDAQFRAEFFNFFNWVNFSTPAAVNPASGTNAQFGCTCSTPDVGGSNPVLGSGGPRHIQFGLKLTF